MLEDDIYRTSSQYRLWSFTKDSLQSIRTNTNSLASERVRAAIHRAQETRQLGGDGNDGDGAVGPSGHSTPNPEEASRERSVKDNSEGKDVECLTPEEELELVQYYCEKTLDLGDEYQPPLPSMVRVWDIFSQNTFHECPRSGKFTLLTVISLRLMAGNRDPIPPPILPLQLTHVLPPKIHHDLRLVPRYEDG